MDAPALSACSNQALASEALLPGRECLLFEVTFQFEPSQAQSTGSPLRRSGRRLLLVPQASEFFFFDMYQGKGRILVETQAPNSF